tara:strand:+ start:419 stop:751 length:333 start_codon:yes stop_codon:yes gene_type:complete
MSQIEPKMSRCVLVIPKLHQLHQPLFAKFRLNILNIMLQLFNGDWHAAETTYRRTYADTLSLDTDWERFAYWLLSYQARRKRERERIYSVIVAREKSICNDIICMIGSYL